MNTNMSPVDWAKRPLEKYADFSGRAPRAEYWWYTLAIVILAIIISIIENIAGLTGMVGPYGPLTALLMLGTFVPTLAVTVRRLHDTDRSAWWLLLIVPYFVAAAIAVASMKSQSLAGIGSAGLLMIVGLIGAVALLVFMILAGTPNGNRFGPSAYEAAGDAVPAE